MSDTKQELREYFTSLSYLDLVESAIDMTLQIAAQNYELEDLRSDYYWLRDKWEQASNMNW